jgi:hypothetical protein
MGLLIRPAAAALALEAVALVVSPACLLVVPMVSPVGIRSRHGALRGLGWFVG